jgi:hypothetical protein
MSSLRRYESEPRATPGRQVVQGGMYRPGRDEVADRQVEIARRWYPSGQLEAERLRIRERSYRAGAEGEHPGCLVRWIQTTLGFLYVLAVPVLGWLFFGWWGAAIGFLVVTIQASRHW